MDNIVLVKWLPFLKIESVLTVALKKFGYITFNKYIIITVCYGTLSFDNMWKQLIWYLTESNKLPKITL